LATLKGHTEGVDALAWSADGTRLATASWDATARLWDGQTGESLATLRGHTAGVRALAWTADGAHLATASEDGTAKLWLGSIQEWLRSACEILEGSTSAIDLDPETTTICAASRETPLPSDFLAPR
jgi:WD40 repeat protein